MSTAPADERLSAYLDGELTDEEAASIEAELAGDPALRAELGRLKAVVALMHDEGPVRAPLGFHASVMARIEAEHPAQPSWWDWLRRPFGVPIQGLAVAAVALMVFAVVAWPDGEAPPGPPTESPTWRSTEAEGERSPAALKTVPSPKEAPLEKASGKADAEGPPVRAKEEAVAPLPAEAPAVDAAPEPAPAEPPPQGRSLPRGYTVVTDDVTSLRTLLATVGRFGGTVTDASGQPLTSAEMTTSRTHLRIDLPTAQLAAFEAALDALGMVQRTFDDKLYYADEVSVSVTLQLAGGSVGGSDDTAPAAARKKALPLDAMEAEVDEAP